MWQLEAIAKANSSDDRKRVEPSQLEEMGKRIHSMVREESFSKSDVSNLISSLNKLLIVC